MVAFGLVMKSDRQLNHALDMQTQMPTRGPVAGQRAPDVFENLMSAEKVGVVERSTPLLKSPWLGGMFIAGWLRPIASL